MMKFVLMIVLCFHWTPVWNLAYAQEPIGLETPFVSRIRVEREGGQLHIFWLDAPSLQGERYEVYRSDSPITAANFQGATLVGTVGEGVQGYSDRPPTAGDYYYAVLARDSAGQLRVFFAPLRNVLVSSVSFTPSAPAAQVLDVEARVVGDRVMLSFRSTDSTANIMIFRTTEYPESRADLEEGLLLATLAGTATTYQDIPPAGLPFYYSAVDARTFTNAWEGLFTVSNRTPQPIGLQLTQVQVRPRVVGPEVAPSLAAADLEIMVPDVSTLLAQNQRRVAVDPETPTIAVAPISLDDIGHRERVLRALTLPKLAVREEFITGNFRDGAFNPLPRSRPIGAPAAAVLAGIAKTMALRELPPPRILPEEASAQQGIGLRLSTVVSTHWEKQSWAQAVGDLNAVLELDLEPKMRHRAHFYRAQAWAYQGENERATLDFILAQQSYRMEVAPFLEVLLLGNRATH